MYIALFCMFLPTGGTYSSYIPPAVQRLMYGKLGSMEDLFLPENADDVTESDMKTVPNINIRELFSDSYILLDDTNMIEYDFKNITSDGEDAREYNEITMKYNFTRRSVYYWLHGRVDRNDLDVVKKDIEPLKINMLGKLSLMYLYHVRYKMEQAFRQREPIRHDKRYKLGYLFNRLRRLQTEMLKTYALAEQQYAFKRGRKFENLTGLMRLYERVIRFDVDIRDTTDHIKLVFDTRAPFDFYGNRGSSGASAYANRNPEEPKVKSVKTMDFGEERYNLLFKNSDPKPVLKTG